MKIRMLTILAGPLGCIDAGATADVPQDMALDLVLGGFADALEPFPDSAPEPEPESPLPTDPDPEPAPAVEPAPEPQPSKKKAK